MRALFLLALTAALLPACRTSRTNESVELTVHAASSLKEAFGEIETAFEAANPGVTLAVNLGGSQELRAQIEHGAPADVFASADTKHMSALVTGGIATAPKLFACNELVVVVPSDRPEPATFAELAGTPRLVIAASEVPVGAYTLQVLDAASADSPDFRAKVEANVVSRELNVRQVLAKVTLGEADAAFVYRTDALSTGNAVRILDVPATHAVRAEYPIAAVTGGRHPREAAAFVEYVLSPIGQARLASRGFLPCGDAPK